MVSVVRAIDVGYGMTKYVLQTEAGGKSTCGWLPSVVAMGMGRRFGSGYFDERNTVVVEWKGQCYEVGQDVALSFRGHNTRVLDSNYIRSDEYQILVRGALKMLGLSRIDLLVLGAPLLNFDRLAPYLESSFTGMMEIQAGERVDVQRVTVLPQPVGGLAWAGSLSETAMRDFNERCLLVDVGYFTVDWLVAEGTRALPERSGSYPGGVSAIIRELAAEISRSTGEDITSLSMWDKIDRHFYANEKLTIYGKPYDLSQHAQTVKSTVAQSVAAIAQRIGDAKDISRLLLVGGGAKFFAQALEALYPSMTVNIVPDAPYANVKGFQLIGQAMVN